MGRFLKAGQYISLKDQTVGGLHLPAGTTAERTASPLAGSVRYNISIGNLEFYDGSDYQDFAVQGNVTITKDSFTGDGSTLVYTLSITPSDENSILVFVGNVHQNPGVAYSLSGATLTFGSPPPDTQTIVVLHGFNSTVV